MNRNDAPEERNSASPADAGQRQPVPLHQANDVVQFWRDVGKEGWFARNDAVDRRFGELCYDLHFSAARRQCEHWLEDPDAALALMLLLDQFPRNVFRDTGHMFATDPLARHYARRIIENGCIEQIDRDLRVFVCLPFAHSESLSDHDYVAPLYQRYAPDSVGWATHHRDIIVRFGRFPHRNRALGRTTTQEEQIFLDDGGFTG